MTGTIARKLIDQEQQKFINLTTDLWKNPETAYNEVNACAWDARLLKEYGFHVETGYANLPTCIRASWGSGHPVIGILGEMDALPGLSQKMSVEQEPFVEGAPGHGCGHCLNNGACISAAGIKAEMEANNIAGTIVLYICPAEEVLTGKVLMAREGAFKELDCAIAYHAGIYNSAVQYITTALNSAVFHFKGVSAHASSNPYDGRSAVDAAELMSVGANYLREHVQPDIKIHYAYQEVGKVPNVVPDKASVWYFVRGANRNTLEDAYDRLVKVAEGASYMTDTQLEVEFLGGCYNAMPNKYMAVLADECLREIEEPEWTKDELAFADELNKTNPNYETYKACGMFDNGPLSTGVEAFVWNEEPYQGSSDVSDVQHICPSCMITTAAINKASVGHSWQTAACSGSSLGMKGMLYGGKVIALLALKMLENPRHVDEAAKEFKTSMNGQTYKCPIPSDVPIPQPQ